MGSGPQKFWMVWNSHPKAHRPTKRYGCCEDAMRDAKSLAAKQPKDKFYVLEAIGYHFAQGDPENVNLFGFAPASDLSTEVESESPEPANA